MSRIGAAVDALERADAKDETFTDALRRVTPTLIVVGVVTGAAFALGGGLVSRFIFGESKRKR